MGEIKTLVCLILVSTHTFVTALHEELSITSDSAYRLPDTTRPTHYDLILTIDSLDNINYDGFLRLYFNVAGTVSEIYLHADTDFVVITSAYLNNQQECIVGNPNEGDILLINCLVDITGQDNSLYVNFTGKFSTEDGFGLVKTSYLGQGTEQVLIESNFKPTYARRAFPCMDEPELEASFSLRITCPEGYTVISTSPEREETSQNRYKTTQFEPTPKISTYLFSIFLSMLREATVSPGDGYEIRVFTRPDAVNMTSMVAGNYSSRIIEQLGDYIGEPYSSFSDGESYHVALPNYYSDAMGGFGLFMYRESELLDEGEKTTARVKQDIITTMAYKLSHEWYGGGVPTKWWSDVWANEAVATYFKYIIPDQVDKEMDLGYQFVVEVIQKALQYDALPFAQPLSSKESDINLSGDIAKKLDTFSYLKGASFLHMMKYVAGGADNLKSALQYHWQQRQDLGTDGQDILQDLVDFQNKEEYYHFLEPWIFSSGFPLITTDLLQFALDYEVIELSQKRFVYPTDDSPDYDDYQWDVPLTVAYQTDRNFNRTLDQFYGPNEGDVYITQGNIWVMFNLQGGSFYRVNYVPQLWRRIMDCLKSEERTTIHVLNRAQLVDDIFNIARTGDVSYALAFELAGFLADETEYYPWYSAFNAFAYLLDKLEDAEDETKLKKYILDLMDKQVYVPSDVPSIDDDVSHVDMLKRVMILDWACNLGHFGCLAYARSKFENYREDQTSLGDYNYRGIILRYGFCHSENVLEDWLLLWNVFLNSPSVHEKNDVLNALGCVEDKFLITSYLQRTITPNSGINKQDALVIFKSLLWSPLGLDSTKDFLHTNFENIASFYNGVDVLSEMLYAVSERLFTDEDLEWVKGIVDSPVLDSYDDVRSKAIVLVSVNNYWRNHYQSDVRNILSPNDTNNFNYKGGTMKELKILIWIISATAYISAASTREGRKFNGELDYRLPASMIPRSYDLYFRIDPESSDYTGSMDIIVDISEYSSEIDTIYLHADTNFVTVQEVYVNNATQWIYCSVTGSNEAQILTIACPTALSAGRNVLSIVFTGKFSTEDGFGLVKTSYKDQGTDQVLIESNFKPIYARRAFPCLDEPHLNASFWVSVVYPAEYFALSNNLVASEDIDESKGLKTTTFVKTAAISTYLVSILISKFEAAIVGSESEYQLKVFTRPEVVNFTSKVFGAYYNEIITTMCAFNGECYSALEHAESFHVAIPDYYSDGMAEFGLFTYRESDLLDEGDRTTARATQDILLAMAYKLSHEWFGGDVSTRWWSDAWANDGFATYLKYFVPHQVNSDFDLANQFVVEVIQKALQLDALPLTRSLASDESDVNSPRDIETKLDTPNSLKGAAILHTLNVVVGGDDKFKSLLQYHLTLRKGHDTDSDDLLTDLLRTQDAGVYSSLRKWAFAPGYPLVTVSMLGDETHTMETIVITHKRFVYPMDNMPSYDNDDWDIPLSSTTQGEKNFNKSTVVFYTPDQLMFVYDSDEWVIFNIQGGSFYRVNYDQTLWGRLISFLKSNQRTDIHVLNRAQLVDDIFSIARTGDVEYSLAFELADFLADETEYYPWYSALNAFSYLLGKFEDYEIENGFKQHILALMEKIVYIPNTVRASHTAHMDILRDVMILDWACYLGHFGCRAYTTEKFRLFKQNQESLQDYNLRGVIFCNGIRFSKTIQQDFDFLWDVYISSPSVHERKDILSALGCAEESNLLNAYLLQTITADSDIKVQDVLLVFKSVFSSSLGLDVAMAFLEDNSNTVANLFNGVHILSEMVYAVAERLLTDEHLQWLDNVIASSPLADYDDVKSKASALASVNTYWKKHYQSEVKGLFPAIATSPTPSTASTTSTITTTTTTASTSPTTTTPSTTTGSSCKKMISNFSIVLMLIVLKLG